MESAVASASAAGQVQECPTLRALDAYDNLLSQGAEGVRLLARARAALLCARTRDTDADACAAAPAACR